MLKEIADLGEKESRGIRGAIKEAVNLEGQYNEDFSGVCDIVKVHIQNIMKFEFFLFLLFEF